MPAKYQILPSCKEEIRAIVISFVRPCIGVCVANAADPTLLVPRRSLPHARLQGATGLSGTQRRDDCNAQHRGNHENDNRDHYPHISLLNRPQRTRGADRRFPTRVTWLLYGCWNRAFRGGCQRSEFVDRLRLVDPGDAENDGNEYADEQSADDEGADGHMGYVPPVRMQGSIEKSRIKTGAS